MRSELRKLTVLPTPRWTLFAVVLAAGIAAGVVAFTGPGADSTRRENVALYSRASEVRSDASGHFVSHQMPAHAGLGIGVAVSHPDFAAQWLLAAVEHFPLIAVAISL